ncbi:uncharacterized protein LOC124279953 [Haliotis rubra]|uniref:uncharacterized protein LOC124279953 n=1 Tax=Haliotis rubra TaxID=36100 RepID=UPI001EE58514|nr:uncharacterized protein LOC124279953 [Haliotis rubra]XP_046571792.1 uncharacterized protein LOC124279953 [Haliotis rubra]
MFTFLGDVQTMVFALNRWRRTTRGKKILLILAAGLIIVIINIICGVNFMDARYPVDYNTDDKSSPFRVPDTNSENFFREQRRRERLQIFQKIFEKQSRRKSQISNQTCQHPHLDLKHDSNKDAFHSMPPLNCTGKSLFYLHNRVARLNNTVLQGKELGKCLYFGIERMTDDFFTYTESLEKTAPPYDLILNHDFLRIQCNYKSSEDEENNNVYPGFRRLMSTEHRRQKDYFTKSQNGSFHETNFKRNHDVFDRKNLKDVIHFSQQPHIDKKSNSSFDELKTWNTSASSQNGQARKLNQLNFEEGRAGDELKEPMNGAGDIMAPFPGGNSDESNPAVGQGLDDSEGFDYQHFMGAEWMDKDFDQFLVQVVPKQEVFERIAKAKSNMKKPSSNMNILIIAMDSMSQLSYQRKLPLTYRYLKEELGAIMLDGYNIVGDATTAALIPMLTGKTEMELPEVRKEEEDANFVDVYPMVWNRFKEAGYATLFAEDEPSISTFNLRFNGFQESPADHYMRPFWQAIWESGLRSQSPRYTTGATKHHIYMLDYLKDFFVNYNNVSKFAFGFSVELTHWDNNPGEYMDRDLVEFLQLFQKKGYLDNTMLVVMGDHGARYSKVRNTVQGKLEERLPMMSLVLPPWFRHEYPKANAALKRNSKRLTTPFDIHETFLDLLNLERLTVPINPEQRGMSVLRDIPDNRTCASARIDIHWCACLHQVKVNIEDKFVVTASEKVVNYINGFTEKLRGNCSELSLKRIYTAYMVLPNEKVLKFQKTTDPDSRNANFSGSVDLDKAHYQITLETHPSDAIYEVTVQVDFRNETYQYHVTPEISRLNLYGDQPKCIQKHHPDLRKYCFCRDFVKPISEVGKGVA